MAKEKENPTTVGVGADTNNNVEPTIVVAAKEVTFKCKVLKDHVCTIGENHYNLKEKQTVELNAEAASVLSFANVVSKY